MRYLLGLTFCLFLTGLTKAEVVYDNLNNGVTNLNENFGSFRQYAQRFTLTSSTSTLDYVILNLFQTSSSTGGNFSVKIYDTVLTKPGAVVSTLANSVNINSLGGTASSTWSMGGGINLGGTLNAGDYWVVVASSVLDANFKWSIGPGTTSVFSASTDGTTWANPSSAINLGGQISVPEPGTLLLGGIAAACGGTGVWWKRRKRQPQPETTEQPAAI